LDGLYKKGDANCGIVSTAVLAPVTLALVCIWEGHVSTFCLPAITTCDYISNSIFPYCKWSKTGGGNGLGMETGLSYGML